MMIVGLMTYVGLLIMHMKYALSLAVLAGLLEVVPMIGPTLGAIPAILVALSISPVAALLVVVYSLVIQITENQILVPRMMGRSVGVSPIMVILAIFAFTNLLGVTGAFLAIPLAAILQVLMDHLIVNAGVLNTEEPSEVSINVMSDMAATIRRLRAEGLKRLRSGSGRIILSTGNSDDVDSQADQLLNKAEQALTKAAQTATTDTTKVHTELLAKVDLAINQASQMVEKANAETAEAETKGKT